MGEKIGFLEELRRALDEHGLRGRRVAVAVSGGADSTALLRGLVELSESFRLKLLAVHVDHGLRGDQSRADAEWTAALCQGLRVPFERRAVEVFERAEAEQIGLEEAARSARYEVLERVAAARRCSHLAVAHTADDQAETVLHHILRGTGVSGLRGMLPVRRLESGVWLVRPLLRIPRRQVEQFLNELGQEFRTDPSNQDLAMTRNRIRHRLMPLLEQEFNPRIREVLNRLAQQAAEIEDVFESLCRPLVDRALVDVTSSVVRLDCTVLASQPKHLVRECLVRIWARLDWPRQKMGFAEWDRLAELCFHDGGVVLPGAIRASRRGDLLVLERRDRPRGV